MADKNEGKSEDRLAMEKKAAELGVKGNIAAMKHETLAKKIEGSKEPLPSSPVAEDARIIVGKNACKSPFGIAGKVFAPGADVILTPADMENRNTSARVTYAKKLGMIK